MCGIIFLIVGIVYACRIPGILKLDAYSFPAQDPVLFDQWRRKELQGIYIFLAATWGVAIVSFGAGLMIGILTYNNRSGRDDMVSVATIIGGVLFLAGIIWAAIVGSAAAKMKKKLMIPGMPRTGGAYPRAGQTFVNMPAPPPEPPKYDA